MKIKNRKNYLKLSLILITCFMCIFLSSCPNDEPTYDNEYENNGENSDGNLESSSSNSIPGNIEGKFLHILRSDGHKLVVEHLNNKACHIVNQEWISYIDGYAPEYKYNKTSSKSAKYFLMYTPSANPLDGGFRRFIDIILTYESSSQGHFVGTIWREGYSNDLTPIRVDEKEIKGVYYLGGANLPKGFDDNSSDDGYKNTFVNEINIISADKCSQNSVKASFIIDVDGKYDEAGLFVKGFDNSLESYAFNVKLTGIINAKDIDEFKSETPKSYQVVQSSEIQEITINNFIFKKINYIWAYVIVGDRIYIESVQIVSE